MDRGKIRNREQAQQIRDFSGLRWGTITPTDIDGYFEMNNELFVFVEIKFAGRELPYGQKLALERLVDIIPKDKKAILIVAGHNENTCTDIDAANCQVMRYRYAANWYLPKEEKTLKQFLDTFIDKTRGKE